jgi:hypothetical protein
MVVVQQHHVPRHIEIEVAVTVFDGLDFGKREGDLRAMKCGAVHNGSFAGRARYR